MGREAGEEAKDVSRGCATGCSGTKVRFEVCCQFSGITHWGMAFYHLEDAENRFERNETKIIFQYLRVKTQDLSSGQNILGEGGPMGKKSGSPDPSLYKEALGMELYHHTTVLKSPYGQRSCPPSASQDSAGPSTLPSRLTSPFQLHGQSLTSTCPCCLAVDLHCHLTANQLVTSLTAAVSPGGKLVSLGTKFCPDICTKKAGTFHFIDA